MKYDKNIDLNNNKLFENFELLNASKKNDNNSYEDLNLKKKKNLTDKPLND